MTSGAAQRPQITMSPQPKRTPLTKINLVQQNSLSYQMLLLSKKVKIFSLCFSVLAGASILFFDRLYGRVSLMF